MFSLAHFCLEMSTYALQPNKHHFSSHQVRQKMFKFSVQINLSFRNYFSGGTKPKYPPADNKDDLEFTYTKAPTVEATMNYCIPSLKETQCR